MFQSAAQKPTTAALLVLFIRRLRLEYQPCSCACLWNFLKSGFGGNADAFCNSNLSHCRLKTNIYSQASSARGWGWGGAPQVSKGPTHSERLAKRGLLSKSVGFSTSNNPDLFYFILVNTKVTVTPAESWSGLGPVLVAAKEYSYNIS